MEGGIAYSKSQDQPVVHGAPKAKQISMWKGKVNMWEFHPIFGKKKPGKSGTFCIYVGGWHWTEKNTAVGFQRQKEEVGSPPKDLMKLLFNPYKIVGVYVENVCKTIFPIADEKKGKDFQMHAFVRSGCVHLMLRMFVWRIYFFQNFIMLDHKQPSAGINTIGKPSGTMK